MTIYEELDKLKLTEIEKAWLGYCHNCSETQNTVLEDILKSNENTDILTLNILHILIKL